MQKTRKREKESTTYSEKEGPIEASHLRRKNKKRNVYDTDAILSTEFPVFHEDFSGRSGWRRRGCTYNADSDCHI